MQDIIVNLVGPGQSLNKINILNKNLECENVGFCMKQKQYQPVVLWLTGISGAGKSTVAQLVQQYFNEQNIYNYILDGDIVRKGLCADLNFTNSDRNENVRRIAEVAKLMLDAGLFVIVALISPYRAERFAASQIIGEKNFVEIFIDTPLDIAESRDVKGLYKRARSGEIKNFTGVDSPYEAPIEPALRVRTVEESPEKSALQVIEYMENHVFLNN